MNHSVTVTNLSFYGLLIASKSSHDQIDYVNLLFSVALTAVPLSLNLGLMAVFFFRRDLWTPFDTYFVSLMTSNIAFHAIQGPINALMSINRDFPIGNAGCMVFIYSICVIAALQMLTHAYIALTRIWALWMPISFHHFHSFKSAWYSNVIVWLLAHLIGLPAAIADVVFYRRPSTVTECVVDDRSYVAETASVTINEVLAVICFVITIASFPLVTWKQRARALWRKRLIIHPDPSGLNNLISTLSSSASKQHVAKKRRLSNKASTASAERCSCILMGALTLSLLVFWGPYIFYLAYAVGTGQGIPEVDSITSLLFNCQSIADPVLIVMAVPVWRKNVKRLFLPC